MTLIESESVEALFNGMMNPDGQTLGIKLPAGDARRNIVTVAVPVNHLVDKEFWVGEVLLRGPRLCEPCIHVGDVSVPKPPEPGTPGEA